jgi:FkbM family methyltransferase
MTGRDRLYRGLRNLRPALLAAGLKRALRVRRVVVDTPHGSYWLDPVFNLACVIASEGSYEPEMQQTLAAFLAPGKIFIDLGANEGYFTVQAAKLTAPNGRAIAVEPQDRLISVIAENIRLNGLSNVTIVHIAISDERGKTSLHLSPDINTGGSSFYRNTKYPLPTQEIATMPLTDLLHREGIEQVDLMKVDIEGAEYEAILGSRQLFEERRIKALALELHPAVLEKRGRSAGEIKVFLTAAGYQKKNDYGNSVWLAPDS